MTDNRLWSGLALFATLNTTAWLARSLRARRTGKDPADQLPPSVACERIRELVEEVLPLAHQLALAPLRGEAVEPEGAAALLHRAEILFTLQALRPRLHEIHQHLLSLYPAVEAETTEAVRQQTERVQTLLEGDDVPDETALVHLAEAVRILLENLARNLPGTN